MKDVLKDVTTSRQVLDHGYIRLVDVMPRLVPAEGTADFAITRAARTSYGKGTKSFREDRELIRYLMRNKHTSPLEAIETQWHMKLPIAIARQVIRHRTASVSEASGRYSEMELLFFRPESAKEVRKQSTTRKQGADGFVSEEVGQEFLDYLARAENLADVYEDLCKKGVDRGLTRMGLPISIYTSWYWKMDLKNLLHFISLRMSPHAQEEVRVYAEAMYNILHSVCPIVMTAFKDYVLDAVTLTGPELRALKNSLEPQSKFLSKGEERELEEKLARAEIKFGGNK